MDDCEIDPRNELVRDKANLILSQRGKDAPLVLGKTRVTNYIKRKPELDSPYSRRRYYQRALCEDSKLIQQWFDLVQEVIHTNGIHQDNIYNFDETSFAMGLCSSTKVVTYADYYRRRAKIQPGNREWVTAIETISAGGWALPPTIIFKAKTYNLAWFSSQINYPRN
jgi:hypothetical protein